MEGGKGGDGRGEGRLPGARTAKDDRCIPMCWGYDINHRFL